MAQRPRVMMIGAHPDDCDIYAGGLAALWTNHGLEVEFVSATNGDAGHQTQRGVELAQRRAAECHAAGAVLGIRYGCLDHHDGELTASLESRRTIIRTIRAFQPDLLLTHRLGDYHADHRATSQLVQDAAFLLTVPSLCPDAAAMRQMPIIMQTEDSFSSPAPFEPSIVVDIEPVFDLKVQMVHAHESQVYEWLPWLAGDSAPTTPDERLPWLAKSLARRGAATAERFRKHLTATYGEQRGTTVRYAEALAITEYGAPLTEEARRLLFPFLP